MYVFSKEINLFVYEKMRDVITPSTNYYDIFN